MAKAPRSIRRRFTSQAPVIPIQRVFNITTDPSDGGPSHPKLQPLRLTAWRFQPAASENTLIARIRGVTPGAAVSLVQGSGQFKITGNSASGYTLVKGPTASSSGAMAIKIRQTMNGAQNGPTFDTALSLFGVVFATQLMPLGVRTEDQNREITVTAANGSFNYSRARLFLGRALVTGTKITLFWPGHYTTGAGSATPETDATGVQKIRAAYLEVEGVGVTQILSSGVGTFDVPSGTGLVTTTTLSVPTGARVWVRISRQHLCDGVGGNPASATLLGGLRMQTQNGEAASYTSTNYDSWAAGTTTFANNLASTRIWVYGPSMAFQDGWDGRSSPMLWGDSTEQGGTQHSELAYGINTGAVSIVQHALTSSSLTTAQAAVNVATPGAAYDTMSNFSLTGRQFGRRYDALSRVRDTNAGQWPFTYIWNGMNENQVSRHGVADGVRGLIAAKQAEIKLLKTKFPGVPIVLVPTNRSTTSINSMLFSSVADQRWSPADGPDTPTLSIRTQFDDWLMTKCSDAEAVIDYRSGMRSPSNSAVPRARPYTSTLAASATAGTTTITVNNPAPSIGAVIVIDPGIAGLAEAKASVTAAADQGNGTTVLTFTRSPSFGSSASSPGSDTLQYNHVMGAVVVEAWTWDGVHYSIASAKDIAESYVVSKLNSSWPGVV